MIYALHEALVMVEAEGLAARFARHQRNARALWAGLEAMGLKLVVEPALRAYPLTTVFIPEGVEDAPVRSALLNEHGIEIGGGLGAFRGKAWRIGLMGYSSRGGNVLALLAALERVLARKGYKSPPGAGTAAAAEVLGMA
jgi:alanine-glyoxylate transaminase/serine-glyoxylate transaminase/serine-pyruvate transaminase